MTCFIKDIRSYSILFETLRTLGAFSELKVNKDKTEALAIGNNGSLWISKDLVKEAESIFYHFIWNGKDKVKRNAVISEVENGGLNMLDTESTILTKRVKCLQKFLEDYESPWKMF